MQTTTWYLEQTDPAQLTAARMPAEPVAITRSELVNPEFSRFLYTAVGGDWFWLDRLHWSWQQWHDWLDRPGIETWVAYVRGTPAGFVELDGHRDGAVEISYFGLLPGFLGRGIGGHLLTEALRRAWDLPARWPERSPIERVWVHTCSLDGDAALTNYQARGLRIYRTETADENIPDVSPGPWPNAGARPNR